MIGRLIKLLISSFIAIFDTIVRGLRAGQSPGYCAVITYHTIRDELRPRFRRQLDVLLQMTRPISAVKESLLNNGERCIAVTVDDAFCSFVQNGLPELCERKIPVTVFVPTGYVGRKSAWDDRGSNNRVGEEVASLEDLKRMARYDNVDFGSHCVTHPDLTLLTEEAVERELRDSKVSLEAIVGRKVIALSFPYGSYGPRELRLAKAGGYRFCFDSTPESVTGVLRTGLIGRVDVQLTDWEIEFRLKISGAYRWVRSASSCKRRMLSLLGRGQSHRTKG